MDKIWGLSIEMTAKLLHKGKNKSEVSELFIQAKSCNLLTALIKAKYRYEVMNTGDTQLGSASREIHPESMNVNITEIHKREEIKMNNILTEKTFLRAKAIWSAQQALKSEVETFYNAKMKRNHHII